MAKLIKDISKTQKKINDTLIEQALGAKMIGIKIDTRKAPISLMNVTGALLYYFFRCRCACCLMRTMGIL